MDVRIGVIGAGQIGNVHMKNLFRIKATRIVAICDPNKERVSKAVATFGGKGYFDYRSMLDKEKLDAIYVCIPPFAHDDQELLAVEKGLHLFIEKPLSLTLGTAERINNAIKHKGIIASVGYQWRYLEGTDRAKNILENREIKSLVGFLMWGIPEKPWWRNKTKSGGQLLEQTIHLFDLARYIVGEVDEVYSITKTSGLKSKKIASIEEASITTIRFISGAMGVIISSCLLWPNYEVCLRIFVQGSALQIKRESLIIEKPGENLEIRETKDPYFEEDNVFIQSIKRGSVSKIRSPYSDALKTHRIVLAALKSANDNNIIRIDHKSA